MVPCEVAGIPPQIRCLPAIATSEPMRPQKTILLDMARSSIGYRVQTPARLIRMGNHYGACETACLADVEHVVAATLTHLSSQQHGCERIAHCFRRLSRSWHGSAIYLVDLRARTNHILARETCCVSYKGG